jgi:hypothetical protein
LGRRSLTVELQDSISSVLAAPFAHLLVLTDGPSSSLPSIFAAAK